MRVAEDGLEMTRATRLTPAAQREDAGGEGGGEQGGRRSSGKKGGASAPPFFKQHSRFCDRQLRSQIRSQNKISHICDCFATA